MTLPPDTAGKAEERTLAVRVRVIGDRFAAIAIGAEKRLMAGGFGVSLQDIANAERDALTLHQAATALEGEG